MNLTYNSILIMTTHKHGFVAVNLYQNSKAQDRQEFYIEWTWPLYETTFSNGFPNFWNTFYPLCVDLLHYGNINFTYMNTYIKGENDIK